MMNKSTVFNIRLHREELAKLESDAAEAKMSLAEYLRKSAALHPLTSVLAKPQMNVSISTPYFQYSMATTWNEAIVYPTTYSVYFAGK